MAFDAGAAVWAVARIRASIPREAGYGFFHADGTQAADVYTLMSSMNTPSND